MRLSVSTPDHTHAAAAMTAMLANKHVYCQKPLTHDIYEARQLAVVAKERGLVTQMGTQVHSAREYRSGVRLIQSGKMERSRKCIRGATRPGAMKDRIPKPSDVPATLEWDLC